MLRFVEGNVQIACESINVILRFIEKWAAINNLATTFAVSHVTKKPCGNYKMKL